MAQKPEDPKKLAAKIAKTRELAGGRKVTINATPSAGMPGSTKKATMGEVVITAEAPKKAAPEKKYQVGQSVNVKQFGGGSLSYDKQSLLKAAKGMGLGEKVSSILNAMGGNTITGDASDLINTVIKKAKIPVFEKKMSTVSEMTK